MSSGTAQGSGEFEAFVEILRDELDAEYGIEVVSAEYGPAIAELLVTTQAESTGDDVFHRELGTLAGVYASYVEWTDEPPALGLLVDAFETVEAAEAAQGLDFEERAEEAIGTYEIQTEWAEEVRFTQDLEAYSQRILLTVEPPIWEDEQAEEGEIAFHLRYAGGRTTPHTTSERSV